MQCAPMNPDAPVTATIKFEFEMCDDKLVFDLISSSSSCSGDECDTSSTEPYEDAIVRLELITTLQKCETDKRKTNKQREHTKNYKY